MYIEISKKIEKNIQSSLFASTRQLKKRYKRKITIVDTIVFNTQVFNTHKKEKTISLSE